MTVDGEVPWEFRSEDGGLPEALVTDDRLAAYEAQLTADRNDAAEEAGEVDPVDWRTLTSSEAEAQWRALNKFVAWLRTTYGLPPTVLPPLWHRHPELVWELSALHTHWLACFEPGSSGSGPIAWHADFADARERLREWVSISGTRLDRDRPTRTTTWPGEAAAEAVDEQPITDRHADFAAFVEADVAFRRATQARAARRARDAKPNRANGGS